MTNNGKKKTVLVLAGVVTLLFAGFCLYIVLFSNPEIKVTYDNTVSYIKLDQKGYPKYTPDIPEKDGYVFVHWQIKSTAEHYDFTKPIKKGSEVFAVFAPAYIVKINYNDGTPVKTVKVAKDTALSSQYLEVKDRDGYIFNGWFESDKLYHAGNLITHDTELTASWLNIYTVRFVIGENNPDVVVKVIQNDYVDVTMIPQIEENDGAIFEKWIYLSDLSKEYNPYDVITQDTTIIAKWLGKYIVTFQYNNGQESTEAIVLEGKTVKLPEEEPVREGFKFLGWYNINILYNETPIVSNTIIEAKWQKVHTVSLVVEDETIDTLEVLNGESVTIPAPPAIEGFSFDGWYMGEEKYLDQPIYSDISIVAKYIAE